MVDSVEFQVIQGNATKTKTLKVENKKLINCVFPNWKDGTAITNDQYLNLKHSAKVGGDGSILETCDLNSKQKIQQAKLNGYNDFYDIELSPDGKYYLITVKKTPSLYPDPQVGHLKKDFGLRENVFIENNRELLPENTTTETGSFDSEIIKGGTTFKLPVEETSFTNGASGFWGRLFLVV
jgi:hypothetical protein